jgi:hypothetical protein
MFAREMSVVLLEKTVAAGITVDELEKRLGL